LNSKLFLAESCYFYTLIAKNNYTTHLIIKYPENENVTHPPSFTFGSIHYIRLFLLPSTDTSGEDGWDGQGIFCGRISPSKQAQGGNPKNCSYA
jgi:hypothetical protein